MMSVHVVYLVFAFHCFLLSVVRCTGIGLPAQAQYQFEKTKIEICQQI